MEINKNNLAEKELYEIKGWLQLYLSNITSGLKTLIHLQYLILLALIYIAFFK